MTRHLYRTIHAWQRRTQLDYILFHRKRIFSNSADQSSSEERVRMTMLNLPQTCPCREHAPAARSALRQRRSPLPDTAERVTCSARSSQEADSSPTLLQRLACGLAATATVLSTSLAVPQIPQAHAALTAGESVKNPRALLRYALPIESKEVRQIQQELEAITEELRVPGSKPVGPIQRTVRKSESQFTQNKDKIIAAFAPEHKDAGLQAMDRLQASFKKFDALLESKDKQGIPGMQQECLGHIGDMEAAMVKEFPFTVPSEYKDLPQLKGRATVEMKVNLKEARNEGVKGGIIRMVADGFNAPVTAGNFVDLVSKKFYDNMEVQRADGFIVQTGNPGNEEQGYVDEAGKLRKIPFEVMVRGDKLPVYGETLEDNGRFNEIPTLPFNAFGTMALARSEFETNSGSSQVFWLLKESELTPTGSNLLDGRYAVFGYIVENEALLQLMQVGDTIEYAKVTDGLSNLERPAVAQAPKDGGAPAPSLS